MEEGNIADSAEIGNQDENVVDGAVVGAMGGQAEVKTQVPKRKIDTIKEQIRGNYLYPVIY